MKPLRSLFIQAENDIGDLAEMLQGVCTGMQLSPAEAGLRGKMLFYRGTVHSGGGFASIADRLIKRHEPDLVWIDPLLNSIGDDASQQKVVSEICCHLLNPISERTGVIWCIMHHTGKPSAHPTAKSHWTGTDLAYSGLGSSALTNWAREVAVLNRIKLQEGRAPSFAFTLCKRRKRAGMTDVHGKVVETIYLQHAAEGLCWEQCEKPEVEAKAKYKIGSAKRNGRPKAVDTIAEFAELSRLDAAKIAELSAKYEISKSTVKRRWREFQEGKEVRDEA